MSDSSPLIPQGSLLEQQARGRPHLRIALCIVAVHLVFLGGLLMQGCKRDEPGDLAGGSGLPTLELTNTLPPLPLDAAPVTPQERTVPPTGFGQPADAAQVPPVPPGFVPPSTATEDVVGAPSDRVPPVRETTPPVRETTPPVAPAVTEHTVVRGETFYGLAQRYGVTVSDITQANPRIEASRLQVGQKLVIPAPRTDRAPSAGAGTAEGGRTYVVKRGDTLTKIAQQHGVTVSALKDLNGLVTDLIVVDQKLKLPPSGSGATGSVRN